ncbi:MAG: hypothetical protein KIS86_04640 [Devosia sp.]|nr:hypothetical protein [Devosia sp.]
MMDLSSVLIGLATEVGAPIVKQVLEQKFGRASGQIAEAVIKSIADNSGVSVEQLPEIIESRPAVVKDAIAVTEVIAPELVSLYARGLDGQFSLLQAETAEGPLQSGWRWGWMYLLGFFWTWVIVILPVVDLFGVEVPAIDLGILLTLTSWFIALYMGGHTVKELGKSALDAVKSWKTGA